MNERILVRVGQWYYLEGLTQEAIARKMGTSRSTVSRLLSQAHKLGIIKVDIATDVVRSFDVRLEHELERIFRLDEAVVVDSGASDPTPAVAQASMELLARSITRGAVIGLSWGRSMAAVVDQSFPSEAAVSDLTIVALSGGLGSNQPHIMSNSLVMQLAGKLNARAVTLDAPAIMQSRAALQAMLQEPTIAPVLSLGQSAQVAMVGIGAVGQFSTLTTLNYMDPSVLKTLVEMGAVGDICSRFYTIDGTALDTEIDHRTLGIDLPTLKSVPRVIAVAWGAEKAHAVLGALRMGILDVLVTDRTTAQIILNFA